MAFYDLSIQERADKVLSIQKELDRELRISVFEKTQIYFSDADTYIRKAAYISLGRIYFEKDDLKPAVIKILKELIADNDFKVRQTVINAAGEIGKRDFEAVTIFFDQGLIDRHHSPRNAVIGSIKKMGEVNPVPVLEWARKYLHHQDKEIRREICHGIELRGRKYPQDILPLLQELQHDHTARVRKTLVHVLGQIAYKRGCLAIVVEDLKTWENKALVSDALEEIIDVHKRYQDFAAMTHQQAMQYISEQYQG